MRIIGTGGFGTVYEYYDEQKKYACKCIEKKYEKMALREYNILKDMNHPQIPKVYNMWTTEENINLLMEFIEGETLQEWLEKNEPIGIEEKVKKNIVLQVGEIISYLHHKGVIYRDLKPTNIMVQTNGTVKLVDFGSCCRVEEKDGIRTGTNGFAAPEQLRDGKCSLGSDLYSLGKLVEMLYMDKKSSYMYKLSLECTKKKEEERIWDIDYFNTLCRFQSNNINYNILCNIIK